MPATTKTLAAFVYAVSNGDGASSTGDEIDLEIVAENDVVSVRRSARFEQLLKNRNPGALEKEPKYDERIREVTKKARGFRGKDNAVAPVTCQRVEALLSKAKKKPEDVIGAFKSKKDALAFAGGDKEVKMPDLVKTLSETTSDPYARGRARFDLAGARR